MLKRLDHLSATATARLAGIGYLALAVLGGFAYFGIRERFVIPGDATATAQNLLANATLWRSGIVIELVGQVIFLFIAFALYDLLKIVHRKRAVTMVTLVAIAVTLTSAMLVFQGAALMVLEGGSGSAALDPATREALASLFMAMHNFGYNSVAAVFFGLWLIPLGVLIWSSRFIPRFVGALLIVAGAGYLIDVVLGTMMAQPPIVLSEFTFVGELVLMLWLIVRGVNARTWQARQLGTSVATA